MSTSRLSRCATCVEHPARELVRDVDAASPSPGSRRRRTPASQAGDVHVVGDPAGGGQLRGRRQRPVGDQREQHPLHHRIPPACRRRAGAARCRSPAGATARPAATPRPAGGTRRTPAPAPRPPAPDPGPPAAGSSPPPGSARRSAARSRPGRADRRGRRSTAPSSARSSPPGPTRCGPAAGRTPASRPGSAGSTFARTRHQTLHDPQQLRAPDIGQVVLLGISACWTRSHRADLHQHPRSCTRSPISCGTQDQVLHVHRSHTRQPSTHTRNWANTDRDSTRDSKVAPACRGGPDPWHPH